MKDTLLKEKPLFQSTLGDLVEVLKEELGFASETTLSDFLEGLKFRMQKSGSGEVRPVATSLSNKGLVYGTFGLVFVLGCSVSTAQRIKSSGVIDAAISQNGKVVVIDVERALDILRVSNKKWGRK